MKTSLFFLVALLLAACASPKTLPVAKAPVVRSEIPVRAASAKPVVETAPAVVEIDVIGYLVRDDGHLGLEVLDGTQDRRHLRIEDGPVRNELEALLPAEEHRTEGDFDAKPAAWTAYRKRTMYPFVGPEQHGLRLSSVIVSLRGALHDAALDATKILDVMTLARAKEIDRRYAASLAKAKSSFERNDPRGARDGLLEARDVISSGYGSIAPSLDMFRLIGPLAERFAAAYTANVEKTGDVADYADAILPVGQFRVMKVRHEPFESEQAMVIAAYRFARRAIMRELVELPGGAKERRYARRINLMAKEVPMYDREMLQWVFDNIHTKGMYE